MSRANAFCVEGVVTVALPNGTYRARLANGHELLAFVTGRRSQTVRFDPGDRVQLQLTPFDLSTGRILTEAK
jgi:translation initiation factor IF-1